MTARADIAVGAWMAHAELARTLWDEGLLASDIARRVGHGCTKNGILGYAHRHGWPPRPSPIAVNGIRASAAVPRQPYKPKKERKAAKARKVPAASTAPPEPRQPAPPPEPTYSRGCQWIETGADERPRRWCGAAVSAPGSAWCMHHRAIVYVTRRTPWQTAA